MKEYEPVEAAATPDAVLGLGVHVSPAGHDTDGDCDTVVADATGLEAAVLDIQKYA